MKVVRGLKELMAERKAVCSAYKNQYGK